MSRKEIKGRKEKQTEEIKLFICSQHDCVRKNTTRNLPKNILELTSKFCMVVGIEGYQQEYKVNIQKLVYFYVLTTNSRKMKQKIIALLL